MPLLNATFNINLNVAFNVESISTVERQKGLTAVLAKNDFLSFLEQFLPIFSIKNLSTLKPTYKWQN